MSLKRDTLVLPRLRAQAVEPFLLALAPHLALAAQMDLRLRLDQGGSLLALLPKRIDLAPGDAAPLLGRLAQAFEAAGRLASELERLPTQGRDLQGEPSLTEGILAFLWSRVTGTAADQQDDAAPGAIRAVVESDEDARAAVLSAIARRSRDVRFMTDGAAATVLEFDDDPARGATLVGLRAGGLPAGVTLLRHHGLAAMSLWLPEGRAFAVQDRVAVSELLNGLADAGLLQRDDELHFVPGFNDECRVLVLSGEASAEMTPVEALARTITGADLPDETGPALRMQVLHLRPDAEAQQDLNRRLNDRSFPLGYRISLDVIRDLSRSEEDVEKLRAEIDEREARIALIQALGRPQLRLLRFSDAQLPALVDGLRRMPRALRENAGLRYAASHAADRAEPAHFVLYDPDLVQFEGVLPEFYWRAVSGDTPITFWLDPHAEEALASDPDEPMVFVPHGQRILPYIDSFGSSVSGTLRLVLGNLFADASAVLDDSQAQPAFVFSHLAGGRDEIGVELLDLARFAPLKLSLRWINEHILASSPRVADPEELRELAETLYAGQLARDLRKTMSGEVEGLRLEWQQAQVELIHCLDRLSDAVADEVRGLQAQLDTARRFIDMAQGRLAQVTGSLNGLGTALGGLDQEMVAIAEELPDMAAARLAFFQQYGAEMAAGDRIMRDAETEIAAMKDRIGALRDRLELD